MDLGLHDRTVVVTGGSSGIGLATVEALLTEGATVVTCARDGQRLADMLADLDARHPGRGVVGVPADVTRADDVARVVATAVDRFGRLDGLVNNAGGSHLASFLDTDDDAWRDELTLKFGSVLHPVRAALPHLVRAPAPSIINVNAVLARQPEPQLVATSAARAGVLNLSRSLATELADRGVRVNSVLVGLVDSGQWRRRYAAATPDVDYAAWARALAAERGVALGRLGTPTEVADTILFLLSPRASYVTGATLEVDGGVHRHV